jgi:hypothetical protein
MATVVLKRFLAGINGDVVNTDHVVRLYWLGGKLFADMASGADIELKPNAIFVSPKPGEPGISPLQAIDMVSF